MTVISGQSDGAGAGSILIPATLSEGTYRVRARQMLNGATSDWTSEQTVSVQPPIRRFEPLYWTIDLPLTASGSLITVGDDGLRLACTLRTAADVVGMRWESEDRWSARGLAYFTSGNYTGCVLDFQFALTGLPPITDTDGLVMTVTDDEAVDYFVRLANYMTAGDGQSGHIHLDFTGAPVLGGFDPEDDAERTVIPWHRIRQISIGVAAPGYTGVPDPIDPVDVLVEISSLTVSGINTHLQRRHKATAVHELRMTDGYDDAYNLTPARIVDGIWRLGYRDWYVIYVGASHLHALVYDDGEGRLVVDPAHPVSGPARAWFADLFARLTARGFQVVVSQSYEILADVCPTAWQQRDYAGAPARTGWTPPSTLISPSSTAALDYLRSVADWLLGAVSAAGGVLHYQIGEPWWWDGSFGGGGPCIYDAATTALYTAETGQAVPTPRITSSTQAIGIHAAYLAWLGGRLGASTLWLRDEMQTAHPGVTVMLLVFTPQVLAPGAPILTAINLPVASWSHPAFDVVQLEDYDWVTAEEWDLHDTTLSAGTVSLGYPLDHLHYFAGFNLLPEDAAAVWPRILRAADDGFAWGVAETFVWARPQVWRDGWTYPSGALLPSPGPSPDPGPDPVEPSFPGDLAMVANSWGDVMLSWSPSGADPTDHVYAVEILDVSGVAVLRTITLVHPVAEAGRVRCAYPVEMGVPDFDFPPTFLAWRLRVDGGALATSMAGAVPVDDAAFVQRAVAFAGQSNALGHFTTLSGTDGRRDLVSAGAFRRDLASRLGLRDIEVIPMQAAWGSSAADRHADDDPVSGVNYWWDLDAGTPGPRMTEFLAIVGASGAPVTDVIWGQGENDVSAFDPAATPRFSSPSRYQATTEAIIAYMRSALGNPTLKIWFQTLGRAYWGDLPDPPEPTGAYYKQARDLQVEIAAADPNVMIGSWTPGCETIAGYTPEVGNPGFIHYTSPVYHATALELSEAIATGLDRIASPPAWTLLATPANLAADRAPSSSDIVVTWDAVAGATYHLRNISVTTGATLAIVDVTGGSWTFTAAAQNAAYGSLAGYVNVNVAQLSGAIQGPAAVLVQEIGAGGGLPAPTGIAAHHSGSDLVVTWDDVEGATWSVLNRNITNNAVLSTVTVTDPTWTFTSDAMTAVYGFPTSGLYVEVTRVGGGMASFIGTVP